MFQREGVVNFEADFDTSAFKTFLEKSRISPSITPLQLLKNLHCLNNGSLNNAGVLFFTKSIEFPIRQAVCTCVLFKGINKVNILDRKDYSSNMLDNIDNAVNFVKRHTNLEYKIEHICIVP